MKIKDYNDAMEFFRTNDYQAADGAWSEFYQSEVLEPRIMDLADGGRIGFANGPPGTIKKATGPTKKNTGSTSPVKTDTHIYKRTNRHGTVWSDTKSKTAEGWKKRKAHALEPKNIEDIRANLVKNKKKVTMVNNQFIFANEKLEKEFIDDMILRYKYPKTSTAAKNAGVKSNAQIFETYFKGTYSEKGVHDLINRFKKTLKEDFSRLHPSEKDAHKLRRQAKLLITQAGKRISGLDDFPAHHLFPIGDEFAHGTQDFTILDKKTNSQLSGPNKQLIGLAEQRTQLVNDVSSGKINLKEFDIEIGKLDNQAQTIIDGHYKKFPKHDGLLNWRKAGSMVDDQGRFMDIVSKGTIGGDASQWAITDVNKQIKDLSKTELATFRSDIKNIATDLSSPEGRLHLKKSQTSIAFQKFLKERGIVVPGCGRQKVVTGGRITFSNGTCGGFKNADEFAKGDPENFLRTVQADSKAANVINKARPSEMQKVFKWAAKDMKSPTGWIGGDIAISTIFTANAFMEGKTPLEAVDQGLLWFLPEKVLNSYKKSLTEGMSEQDAVYIKRALDLETADNKYFTNKDELDNLEKQLKENPELFGQVTDQQIKNNKDRLINNIDEAADIADNLYKSFGDFERKSDTPYIQGVTSNAPTSKNYKDGYTNAMEKLFEAKKQKAVKDTNIAKQFDLGREYQKHLNDILMPDVIEEALGKGDKDYQDYDILGDKSGLFTDYMPSLTRPLAPITATIGQLAQGYASTDLPLAERLQNYLEKIARLRNKENLTQPATMDNLTQQDFDIANQRFAQGGIASLKKKW